MQDKYPARTVGAPSDMHTLTCVSQDLFGTTPDQEVLDDFTAAQRAPLPEWFAGIEGDEV